MGVFAQPFQIVQRNIIKPGIGKYSKNVSFNKMTMLDEKEIMCLKFDREGTCIAAGLENGYILIYNISTGNISRRFEGSVEGESTTCLRFSPLRNMGGILISSKY